MDQIQSFFPAVRIQYTVILFFQDLSYKGLNIFYYTVWIFSFYYGNLVAERCYMYEDIF